MMKRFGVRGARLAASVAVAAGLTSALAGQAHADYARYGAISIGNNGNSYAIVVGDFTSDQAVIDRANAKCGYTDCHYIQWWDGNVECGAAAVTWNGHWGAANAPTVEEAERLAISRAGWGAGVQVSGCDHITRGPQN